MSSLASAHCSWSNSSTGLLICLMVSSNIWWLKQFMPRDTSTLWYWLCIHPPATKATCIAKPVRVRWVCSNKPEPWNTKGRFLHPLHPNFKRIAPPSPTVLMPASINFPQQPFVLHCDVQLICLIKSSNLEDCASWAVVRTLGWYAWDGQWTGPWWVVHWTSEWCRLRSISSKMAEVCTYAPE